MTESKATSILYLGSGFGTSGHRMRALRRLGHHVTPIDPANVLRDNTLLKSWAHHTGALGIDRVIRKRVLDQIGEAKYDVVWVDGGALIDPRLVQDLRSSATRVINYNVDDPFGKRDGLRFRQYWKSLSHYDLMVVVRKCNVAEARRLGAREVLSVLRSADEVEHAPRILTEADIAKWDSDVTFIGTWMPERGPFLARLIELGVPLAIRGNRYSRGKEWPLLRACWRGPGVQNESEYAKAIQCAKVCLGLLSKGNRDLSTQRSFEIPFLGGVFCAERTAEHLALYREDEEAVFWDTPEECAAKCKQLLSDHEWRNRISRNGRIRCVNNGTLNGRVLAQVLDQAMDLSRQRHQIAFSSL